MYYSDNHAEVSPDAFLASEEYARESIKDMELSVFDECADGSIFIIIMEMTNAYRTI